LLRKAASNPPNVLFHDNGNFGNALRFHFSFPPTSPKVSSLRFFSPSFRKFECIVPHSFLIFWMFPSSPILYQNANSAYELFFVRAFPILVSHLQALFSLLGHDYFGTCETLNALLGAVC
jgi:hypothetical protein